MNGIHVALFAEKPVTGDNREFVLSIRFQMAVTIRMLDEMPLSTEDDLSGSEGLVPHHFAYRVEGAAFVEQDPRHGDWCLAL